MLSSVLIGAGALILAAILLALKWVLGIVREALGEIAREEIKAAIPQVSFGLVRRAAADVPEHEREIAAEWEDRLNKESKRPLVMLLIAIRIYRERFALVSELAAPVPEVSSPVPGPLRGQTAPRLSLPGARIAALLAGFLRRLPVRREHLPVLRAGLTVGLLTALALTFTTLMVEELGAIGLVVGCAVSLVSLYGVGRFLTWIKRP